MIELMLGRLSKARRIDQIVLATSDDLNNLPLVEHVRGLGYEVFLGSESDVLDRFYRAARHYNADTVIRVTGDCPLIAPHLVDEVIAEYQKDGVDYVSNTLPPPSPTDWTSRFFRLMLLKEPPKQPQNRVNASTLLR